MSVTGAAIANALTLANMSQRTLAARTGISQPTLSRIIDGSRAAKMPEIVQIAQATGTSVTQLTGQGVASRAQGAARAVNRAPMADMRHKLIFLLELDAYLTEQGI